MARALMATLLAVPFALHAPSDTLHAALMLSLAGLLLLALRHRA
jgi:hypothetical protein